MIENIVVIVITIYLLYVFFVAVKSWRDFLDEVIKVNPDYMDNIVDLNFFDFFNLFDKTTGNNLFYAILPTNEKSDRDELSKLIKKHNRILEIFWLSAIILIPIAIIIANLH